MNRLRIEALEELEALSKRRVVVYCVSDHPSKLLEDNDAPVFYECLRELGATERLDLVLHCRGGDVNAARRLARMLRNNAKHLRVLVPYMARSAGTLLCLGADEMVLGPMAELSPIDPHIGAAVGQAPAGAPASISSEDIRAFPEMAARWFGLTGEEHRMQIFTLFSQRFFPTSLSSFYRADKEVRQIAMELLRHQLPDAEAADRERIVDRLVSGYPSHDYQITREEVRELGLRVQFPSPEEERLMWGIYQACQRHMTAAMEAHPPGAGIGAVILGASFAAQCAMGAARFTTDGQPIPATAKWETL